MGYESASVRYDYVLDLYGGDVLMRKLLLILALMVPGWSLAAVAITPQIAGYSGGMYRAAASSFAMTAANDGYVAQAVANVAGRQVTMSATMRMAANAGQYALGAMRLNPWGIAGTLAAGWLLQQGLEYLNGQWMKQDLSGHGYMTWDAYPCGPGDWASVSACIEARYPNAGASWWQSSANVWCWQEGGVAFACATGTNPGTSTIPATQGDWDALPDPLPSVATELPSAPYMPDGVPVTAPEYAPQDIPLGEPYPMPDGSTVQDRVSIAPQPNGQVSIVTYNVTVNDAQGNPVTNPTPTPTPDQPPDLCQLHPDSVACMTSGGPPTFTPPTDGGAPADPSIVAAGGAIDWHQHFLDEGSACGLADIPYTVMNQNFTIPLSALCQYLPILKAVVIFLASIVSIRMFALAPW